MIKRIFNLLFALCGIWIMALVWNWDSITALEGVGPIVVIAALPLGVVFVARYLLGQYIDLF